MPKAATQQKRKPGRAKIVLPVPFDLSESDWTEIWNTCDGNIQNKLPVDGIGTTEKHQRKLTQIDWIQIYLSVEDKRDALKGGFYGKDREAREWLSQMNDILETLAPIRDAFIGTSKWCHAGPKCATCGGDCEMRDDLSVVCPKCEAAEKQSQRVAGYIQITQWREYGDDEDSLRVVAYASGEEKDVVAEIRDECGLDEPEGNLDENPDVPGNILLTNEETISDGQIIQHNGRKFRVTIEEVLGE